MTQNNKNRIKHEEMLLDKAAEVKSANPNNHFWNISFFMEIRMSMVMCSATLLIQFEF